jgi:hypothetical protein
VFKTQHHPSGSRNPIYANLLSTLNTRHIADWISRLPNFFLQCAAELWDRRIHQISVLNPPQKQSEVQEPAYGKCTATSFPDLHGKRTALQNAQGESMKTDSLIENVMNRSGFNRRSFMTSATMFGLGAATSAIAVGCGDSSSPKTVSAAAATDTAANIFTAALIAESLAITTYYTALSSSGVITDPNLAGSGGTAINISASGQSDNVAYLQAALLEEVQHAQLLRSLLGLATDGSGDAAAGVPQTFYYPANTFSALTNFLPVLIALETAFIGAYMTAVEEFASMAAGFNGFSATQANPAMSGSSLTQADLILYAKVASSILGVESEHRALVRSIPGPTIASPMYAGINLIPANNVNYEITDGLTGLITSVSGDTTTTAAAALGPFIASGTNPVSVPTVATMASFSSVVIASVAANVTGTIPSAE